LTGGNFIHLIDGFFQPAGLYPENDRLHDSNESDRSSKPHHPPIGRRYVLSVYLVLGGFFLGPRGWENFDHKRRIRSTTMIGGGLLLLLLYASGLLLWLGTFSWGWLL